MLSMTGFGRAERVFPWGTVTLEISSVNHRYQDVSVRFSGHKEAASPIAESRLTALLRSALDHWRGKIRLSVEIERSPEYSAPRIDADVLRSYHVRLSELAGELGLAAPSSIEPFMSMPGVCVSPQAPDGADELVAAVMEAVESLMEMKKSEGAKLKAAIACDMDEFERLVCALGDRWKVASAGALEGVRSRIEKITERLGLDVDENRVAQEVSLMADRWDVSEEIARLASHVEKFRSLAESEQNAGRKLDFLIQEMNREINTMGSKVNDAEFRWLVVDAKSCLERVREQVQNVE
ncbi:MAG: YicC family protein [Synergistaceae bacterium]|jgi:uncharacterized protein (TIGR00255 family)|nr:YicC family protein [Synergistaceae bacterium]